MDKKVLRLSLGNFYKEYEVGFPKGSGLSDETMLQIILNEIELKLEDYVVPDKEPK